MMLFDLHVHTSEYSSCSKVSFEDIVTEAVKKGLDGICITDHDNFGARELVQEYQSPDLLVFLGIEVLTKQGDILVFGAYDIPSDMLDASELINIVKNQGGVTVAAHPYRTNNRGIGDNISCLKDLTAVEVLNGNTDITNNKRALKSAFDCEKVMIGASDAHIASQVGVYATKFDYQITKISDLVYAIKNNLATPMLYNEKDKKYLNWR